MTDDGRRRSARNAGRQGDDTKRRKLGEIPDFNMSERKRIQEAVLAFARPHWTAIKSKTKLIKRCPPDTTQSSVSFPDAIEPLIDSDPVARLRPLADIRSYSMAFLRLCVDAAKGEDKEIFQELLLFMQTQGPKYALPPSLFSVSQ
jgi:hypothetical protein